MPVTASVLKYALIDNAILVSIDNGLTLRLDWRENKSGRFLISFPFLLLFFFPTYITTSIFKTRAEVIDEADSLEIWKHCECGFAVAFLDSGKLYWP